MQFLTPTSLVDGHGQQLSTIKKSESANYFAEN